MSGRTAPHRRIKQLGIDPYLYFVMPDKPMVGVRAWRTGTEALASRILAECKTAVQSRFVVQQDSA